MNERIEEFAELTGAVRYDFDTLDGTNLEELNKFAQLIVKECSKVIRHGGQRKGAFGNANLHPYEIATMIEEHFGVEL
jgi:hypothetical protein